ncbi:MAG: TraR/DksA C4-type zinc finger protein [Candidatus Spechtbacterales bacterium]
MNKVDLEKFKNKLEKTKGELEASLKTFATKDPTVKGDWDSKYPEYNREDPNVNLEEEADEVQEYLTRLPVEHSYELRLEAIGEALERIKKGTYGECANCKSKIPRKRLDAYPEAGFCLKCRK